MVQPRGGDRRLGARRTRVRGSAGPCLGPCRLPIAGCRRLRSRRACNEADGPLSPAAPLAGGPVSIDPDIAASAGRPVGGDPHVPWCGRNRPSAGKPHVTNGRTSPCPVPADPDIGGRRLSGNDFHLWGRRRQRWRRLDDGGWRRRCRGRWSDDAPGEKQKRHQQQPGAPKRGHGHDRILRFRPGA